MIESQVSQPILSERLEQELCKKVAEKMKISLTEVERVINFQFKDLREATGEYASVEIARFGKLLINQSRVKALQIKNGITIPRIKEELERTDITERRRRKLNIDLKLFSSNLEYVKTKIREELRPKKYKEKEQEKPEEVEIEDDSVEFI